MLGQRLIHVARTTRQSRRHSLLLRYATTTTAAGRSATTSGGGKRSLASYIGTVGGGAAVVAVGGGISYGMYYLNTTEEGLGIRRQAQFWRTIFPIVADYVWYLNSRSPYVWYQQHKYKRMLSKSHTHNNDNNDGADAEQNREQLDEQVKKLWQEEKARLLEELHGKHAPSMLAIMLQLKGLYIKLGQVLSVTALPLPDQYRNEFKVLQSNVSGWEDFETTVKPILEKELLSNHKNNGSNKDGNSEAATSLDDIFEYIDPIPCGAASIGQAHRAILATNNSSTTKEDDDGHKTSGKEVIIKVQYPTARWQVPADIRCIGQFLKLCVFFNAVDESSATLSYNEFSRQFLAELDYNQERINLQQIYNSSISSSTSSTSSDNRATSIDMDNPYEKHGVLVPRVYDELCTKNIITMSYFPGPKLQEEAKRRLEQLGIDTSSQGRVGLRALVEQDMEDQKQRGKQEAAQQQPHFFRENDAPQAKRQVDPNQEKNDVAVGGGERKMALDATPSSSWKMNNFPQLLGRIVGVDSMLWATRFAQRLLLWSTAWAVSTIQFLAATSTTAPSKRLSAGENGDRADSNGSKDAVGDDTNDYDVSLSRSIRSSLVPERWIRWAEEHEMAAEQAERLDQTKRWIDALFDVHGHQIFQLGLFNADPHPGNVILIDDDYHPDMDNGSKQDSSNKACVNASKNRLGLIDFGQCKRLTNDEQVRVARFILSIANDESDEEVASAFRQLGIQSQNDSTPFLADFARLMFGRLQPKHLSRDWHRQFHNRDRVLYFPSELSMVYRTSLLLRGLALSLQFNESISDQWKVHAQSVMDRHMSELEKQSEVHMLRVDPPNLNISQDGEKVNDNIKSEAIGSRTQRLDIRKHTNSIQRHISTRRVEMAEEILK